jgi:hypothetical protein
MLRPPHKGGKEAFGEVFAGETCSYGATAIVEDDGRIMQAGIDRHAAGDSGCLNWWNDWCRMCNSEYSVR